VTFLALLPVGLSLLVLAAHFYRAGQFVLCAAMLGLLALTAVRKPWAARTLQAVLVLGALEWLRTMARFVSERQIEGRPFVRLAAILTGVALASALSALLFRTKALRARYGLDRQARNVNPSA
jgi:hypothetical protein